jgi:hypothetical protein
MHQHGRRGARVVGEQIARQNGSSGALAANAAMEKKICSGHGWGLAPLARSLPGDLIFGRGLQLAAPFDKRSAALAPSSSARQQALDARTGPAKPPSREPTLRCCAARSGPRPPGASRLGKRRARRRLRTVATAASTSSASARPSPPSAPRPMAPRSGAPRAAALPSSAAARRRCAPNAAVWSRVQRHRPRRPTGAHLLPPPPSSSADHRALDLLRAPLLLFL